ncbi:MAG: hypothetical protein NHB32_02035 [Fischerella sp. CENA71]|nr:hypothetical protein [Fischerella sp. CENA71]
MLISSLLHTVRSRNHIPALAAITRFATYETFQKYRHIHRVTFFDIFCDLSIYSTAICG